LRARLRLSGDTLDVDGTGPRAVRPAAPSWLVIEGRRTRNRRRLAAGSFAAAASVVVAGAGAGVGAGVVTLPWLRADGTVSPGTLYASSGSRVGDLINDIDTSFGSYSQTVGGVWRYQSGPDVPDRNVVDSDTESDAMEVITAYGLDRLVRTSLVKGGARPEIELTLSRTDPGGGNETAPEALGTLTLGPDGRGTWLRARPSAEDGWLLFAVLPTDAGAVQVRVAGTEVVLPLAEAQLDFRRCGGTIDRTADDAPTCQEVRGLLVHLRIATTSAEPPIDAITYVDQDGRYVVLGAEALVD
jgi:hypothetical protein